MSRLKLGVVGAGAWGRNHVRTVATLADAELAAVCDRDPKVRDRVARQYPMTHVTGEMADLLRRVDAVIVAAPATTHAQLALECIAAGKPCLVEKPFALSVQDAEAVARSAAERQVPVAAGHLLVFHPAVERLRALVRQGELGKLFYLYGLRVNLGQVRADENALWSFGPHDVSMALYLLDDQPTRVAAQGRSYLQPGVEDVVFLTMEFASGILAHVQLSWLDPHKERKLTVVGAKKMVVFDDMEPREKLRIYDKGVDRPPETPRTGRVWRSARVISSSPRSRTSSRSRPSWATLSASRATARRRGRAPRTACVWCACSMRRPGHSPPAGLR